MDWKETKLIKTADILKHDLRESFRTFEEFVFGQLKQEIVFLGYALNGYCLWDPEKIKVTILRDAIFSDSKMPIVKTWQKVEEIRGIEEENADKIEFRLRNQKVEQDLVERYNLRPTDNLQKPKRYSDCDTNISELETVMFSFENVMNGSNKEKWIAATEKEKRSLLKNETWT